jgi:hypothetical protein
VLLGATPVGTAGAADYVQIMGVQLEIGAQATPFEHRDIELGACLCNRDNRAVGMCSAGSKVDR